MNDKPKRPIPMIGYGTVFFEHLPTADYMNELEAENTRLRKALEWYAVNTPTIGKRARAALKETP